MSRRKMQVLTVAWGESKGEKVVVSHPRHEEMLDAQGLAFDRYRRESDHKVGAGISH